MLNKVLLTTASVLVSLLMAELALRLIHPHSPTFGAFFPRYRIDNAPASAIGYFQSDQSLPFSLKPGFDHTVEDRAWHPKPFHVQLDAYGYRNRETPGARDYDLALVGDSVAFGYGVDDDQTIPSRLGASRKVYSLAIPGAGPDMYMQVIDRFLKRASAKTVAVLFYEGNDYYDLENSSWEGLSNCRPPLSGRIQRHGVSADPDNPPPLVYAPLFRNSALVFSGYTAVLGLRRIGAPPPCLSETFRAVSGDAIAEIEDDLSYDAKASANAAVAIPQLEALAASQCVDKNSKQDLLSIAGELKSEAWKSSPEASHKARWGLHISTRMRDVSRRLISDDCYPIDKDFRNLTVKMNYFGGYFYESLARRQAGYHGEIYNYYALLGSIDRHLKNQFHTEIARLRSDLILGTHMDSIRSTTGRLQIALDQQGGGCHLSSSTCDKMNIFLDYLASLNTDGRDVILYVTTGEQQLETAAKSPRTLCRRAREHGLRCVDLVPPLLEHYSRPPITSLYLDGSHFTAEGNRRMAQWIEKTLGR